MAGAEQPNPYLEPEEIRSLSHVFLTHSHADHTGALPWLEEQGFDGIVAAPPETLSQLKQMPQRTISLNEFSPPDGMTLKWGRSGHCTGSVWYHFHLEGRSLLFSGDYTEHSLAYVADPIRDLHADLAVLDSAYGPETRSAPEMRQGFLSEAAKSCGQGKPLVLPVPKYGRGLELALLLHQTWPGLSFYGDAHFIRQLDWLRGDQAWTTADIRDQLSDLTVEPIPESVPETGVLFLSDPQLRDPRDEGLAADGHSWRPNPDGVGRDGDWKFSTSEGGIRHLLPHPGPLYRPGDACTGTAEYLPAGDPVPLCRTPAAGSVDRFIMQIVLSQRTTEGFTVPLHERGRRQQKSLLY